MNVSLFTNLHYLRRLYLFKKIVESGKQLIGFDFVEVGVGETDWDSNVGAHLLWRMCNLMVKNTPSN